MAPALPLLERAAASVVLAPAPGFDLNFQVGRNIGALLTKTISPRAALMLALAVFTLALTGLTRQKSTA